MSKERLRQLQQTEFFLLHRLLVEELRLLKNVKRFTPVHTRTLADGKATLARLFKSFLIKLFAGARISKQPHCLNFSVEFDKGTQAILETVSNTDHDAVLRTPTTDEIGLLRVDLPRSITVSIGGHSWRRRSFGGDQIADYGIGRHCGAVRTIVAWKERLDQTLAAAKDHKPSATEPVRNIAQEQLDAVLGAARGAP